MANKVWSTLIIAIIIELTGIILQATGLVYEHVMQADLGYQVISCGTIFIAVGALIFTKFWKGYMILWWSNHDY